jgi:hypothetical protein
MLLPYCDLKIPALIFTSHTISHITLDYKQSLTLAGRLQHLKQGRSLYISGNCSLYLGIYIAKAEFMNVQFQFEVSGHNLEGSQT